MEQDAGEGQYYMGAVCYAEDLTLLCPTSNGLAKMLKICEKYGNEYGVSFNAKKTA